MSETQQCVKDIQGFAQNIVDSLREPLLIPNPELRVQLANRAFQVEAEETRGHCFCDLGDGQWSVPALQTLLEEIILNNTTFNYFLIERDFPHIGHKAMLLNARKVFYPDDQAELLISAISVCNRISEKYCDNQTNSLLKRCISEDSFRDLQQCSSEMLRRQKGVLLSFIQSQKRTFLRQLPLPQFQTSDYSRPPVSFPVHQSMSFRLEVQ